MPQNKSRFITLALWLAERHQPAETELYELMHAQMQQFLPPKSKSYLVTWFEGVGQRTGPLGPRRWRDVLVQCRESKLASFGIDRRMESDSHEDWPGPFNFAATTVRKHEPYRAEKQEFCGRDIVFGICPDRWGEPKSGDEIVALMMPILHFAADKLKLFQAHIRVTGVPGFDQYSQKFLRLGARERFMLASEDYVCPAWLTVIHPLLFGRYFESSRVTGRFHTEYIGREDRALRTGHVLVRLTDHVDQLTGQHLQEFAQATNLQ